MVMVIREVVAEWQACGEAEHFEEMEVEWLNGDGKVEEKSYIGRQFVVSRW